MDSMKASAVGRSAEKWLSESPAGNSRKLSPLGDAGGREEGGEDWFCHITFENRFEVIDIVHPVCREVVCFAQFELGATYRAVTFSPVFVGCDGGKPSPPSVHVCGCAHLIRPRRSFRTNEDPAGRITRLGLHQKFVGAQQVTSKRFRDTWQGGLDQG